MDQATRVSYAFVLGLFILVGGLHITVPLITVLFAFFALNSLSFGGRKWLGLILFSVVFLGLIWGFAYFAKQASDALPKIGQETIPKVIEYAESKGLDLPFTDFKSLRTLAMEKLQQQAAGFGAYARRAAVEMVSFVIGVVVAVSLFLSSKLDLGHHPGAVPGDLYRAVGEAVAARFRTFYESFATVMGAQLVISAINTALTSVFLLWNHYPHLGVLLAMTFLSGMLPIIGNLASNALIIGVGFTLSPTVAFSALVFLVVIHKFEYFLNSKIIGDRIRNPMWLTLLGLVLGERLLGIPGMILAPVVLHYVKLEASRITAGKARVEEV
jgi:predicted PurR-regulated permease PerM